VSQSRSAEDVEVEVEQQLEHEPLRQTAVNYYDRDGVTYINGLQQQHQHCIPNVGGQ